MVAKEGGGKLRQMDVGILRREMGTSFFQVEQTTG